MFGFKRRKAAREKLEQATHRQRKAAQDRYDAALHAAHSKYKDPELLFQRVAGECVDLAEKFANEDAYKNALSSHTSGPFMSRDYGEFPSDSDITNYLLVLVLQALRKES